MSNGIIQNGRALTGIYVTAPYSGIFKSDLKKMTAYRQNKLKNEYKSIMDIMLLSMINKEFIISLDHMEHLKISQPLVKQVEKVIFKYTFVDIINKRAIDHDFLLIALYESGLIEKKINKKFKNVFRIKENTNSLSCILLFQHIDLLKEKMLLKNIPQDTVKNLCKMVKK